MKELDQLVENFFQPKRDTLGLDQLVEMVEEVMSEQGLEEMAVDSFKDKDIESKVLGFLQPKRDTLGLDQLVENFFQPKQGALGLDQLVEIVEQMMTEAVDEDIMAVVDDLLTAIVGLQPEAKEKSRTGTSMVVTDTGSRKDRTDILNNIISSFVPAGDVTIEIVDEEVGNTAKKRFIVMKPGSKSFTIKMAQGSVGKENIPNATKFEGNLANALNEDEEYEGSGERFNGLANDIIDSVRGSFLYNEKLKGKTFEKLEQKGTELTKTYKKQGVKSREPKTDLVSSDGSIKLSVKKKGGQFVSAQGPEAAAIFNSVMNKALKQESTGKFAEMIKKYFDYEEGKISKLKGQPPEEQERTRKIRNFLLLRLLNFGATSRQEDIVREALLGENKFKNEEAIPNYFLVWDMSGNGELYTANQFVKMVTRKAKIGIRGRGGVRGLALRGEV
mgnify:CR=1 FL=1